MKDIDLGIEQRVAEIDIKILAVKIRGRPKRCGKTVICLKKQSRK